MTTRFSLLAAVLAAGTIAALPALAQTTPPATGTPPAASSTHNGMKGDSSAGKTTKNKGHHSRSHASRRHKRDSSTTGKQQ